MKTEQAEIVKSGHWPYDDAITYEVWIVRQNFEYHYEEGFDSSERLNSEGLSFAVVCARKGEVVGSISEFLSFDEAVAGAEQMIQQGIQWDNHRLQPLYGGRRYLTSERIED